MAAESVTSALDTGRERSTAKLRTRVQWSLVGLVLLAVAPGLAVAGSAAEVWSLLAGAMAAILASYWVAGYVMAPVSALRRRLELKNYGEAGGAPTRSQPEADIDLGKGGFALGELLDSTSPEGHIDVTAPLPVELAAIERLARAGRVSEIAMETVKRDLFRHLSHQLKSPLALMRAHAQAAGAAMVADDAAAAANALSAIEATGLNMSGLVEQMLSMAWVEGLEERGLAGMTANLSASIMELIHLRERAAAERKVRIEANVQAGLWVRGQGQLLQEMVAALVDNSLRYGPTDSVISVEAGRLPGTSSVTVVVTDHGPGIPVQERERVFEPFYGSIGLDARGNMTYGTRRHRALGAGIDKSSHGLGLALVRAVVKLHGASISLGSGPGGIGLSTRVVLGSAEPPQETDVQAGEQAR